MTTGRGPDEAQREAERGEPGEPIDESREDRVRDWFLEAVEVPAGERARWLDERLGEDPELRSEVEELLRYDAEASHRLPLVTQARAAADGHRGHGREASPSPPRELPERVGPFSIEEEIGSGGMSIVYRARQDSPYRAVALKVLPPEAVSLETEKRFLREVDVLARLRHPGIVRVLEAGTATDDGVRRPYFSMELIEGPTLDEYLRNRRPSIRERVELLVEIADAVHHAHRNKILHRDLKPSNVIVDQGRPRILDFGIAKAIGRPAEATRLTADGAFLGTLPYMSPEQAAGESDRLGERSDLYSLGVVAFEMLTGELPYPVDGKPFLEALRIIAEWGPARPSRIRPGVPQDLDVIVGKLLAKEPEWRYGSAGELAEDLRRFLASEPIQARPPTWSYVVKRAVVRHRGASIGIAIAAAALLVGAIGVIAIGVRAMGDARAERSKSRLFVASVSVV